MAGIDDVLEQMRHNPKGMRFADLCRDFSGGLKPTLQAIERLQNENSIND
jgi:hypothetical protein